ncbi:MAG: hypothetical protein CK532_02275 [Flavobacteriales bacterium]|nr:MAG: hypothetical protein CK532_02275 [Flavobacteriales bacterium]
MPFKNTLIFWKTYNLMGRKNSGFFISDSFSFLISKAFDRRGLVLVIFTFKATKRGHHPPQNQFSPWDYIEESYPKKTIYDILGFPSILAPG